MRPSRLLPCLATLACCVGVHVPESPIIGVDASAAALADEHPAFTDITEASGVEALVSDHYAAHPQWWLNRCQPGKLDFQATDITCGTDTARRQAMIDINRDGHVDWLRGMGKGILFDFGDLRRLHALIHGSTV